MIVQVKAGNRWYDGQLGIRPLGPERPAQPLGAAAPHEIGEDGPADFAFWKALMFLKTPEAPDHQPPRVT